MGLEKVGLKVLFKLTFTLGFSDIRWLGIPNRWGTVLECLFRVFFMGSGWYLQQVLRA